jgi:hypothetical protein
MLDLVLLALEPGDASDREDELIRELIAGMVGSQAATVRNALALALALSATRGVGWDTRHVADARATRAQPGDLRD